MYWKSNNQIMKVGRSMKNIRRLLLLVAPLILTSCLPVKDKTLPDGSQSGSNSNTTNTSVNPSSDTSEEEIDDSSLIDHITLSDKELELTVGERSDSILVNFYYTVPEEEQKAVDRSGVWHISNEGVATIDQYGRVTGVSVGQAKVTFVTNEGSRKATCIVYVVSSHQSVTKEWRKVTNESQLMAGDIVVFGCPEKGTTATSENTGMYLHPTTSTFTSSGDKITNLGSSTEKFVLDGENHNWTFESEEGKYLATTNTSKVTFIYKTGNVHWDIDYGNEWGVADIRSTSRIDGWFMYNSQHERFTTYKSDVTDTMYVITLYKQVRVY